MEAVNKFEDILESWLKPLPHLPVVWRKWLATNVWWLTMIFVILAAMGVLGLLGALLTALSFLGFSATFYGYYAPQAYGALWIVSTLVSLAFLIATVIAAGAAVNPLREKTRRGWELLFLSYVISFTSTLVGAVLSFNAFQFVPTVISAVLSGAISIYLLFEVREYFGKKRK